MSLFWIALLAWNATAAPIEVRAKAELARLLKEQDTDRDTKITVGDLGSRKPATGRFALKTADGKSLDVVGTFRLANLLQELKLASDRSRDPKSIDRVDGDRILENPVEHLSRNIRELYWAGLTRVMDREHLPQLLGDSKVRTEIRYLYVPHGDDRGYEVFSAAAKDPALRLKVVRLPAAITPEFVRGLEGRHGLLALEAGVPFVVPGGRFNEMYGWDTHFESLGVIADGKPELARGMVDQFVYQIRHYGKILNANRTYYLTRSQPPFLPSLIRAVREALPATAATQAWLERALAAAIREYETVWMSPDRLTATGLSRYNGSGLGIPPEVEPGHFDPILLPFAAKREIAVKEYARQYQLGLLKEPALDDFFRQDRAVRESGHDTTYRWRVDGKDRAADFVTVDLNSLLYKFELEIAHLIDAYAAGGKFRAEDGRSHAAREWRARAAERKKRMLTHFWDPKRRLFFDYDFVRGRRSDYVSATTLYPLWAFDPALPETRLLSEEDTRALVRNALAELEQPGGIAATSAESLRRAQGKESARQWEFPNGWAPHQMLIWTGLRQSGFGADADRLVYKWLYLITRNATDYQGTIPEKYDVVRRSHQVFAEYGNVGTKFDYITREGFGWMNASYQVGLKQLPPALRKKLEELVPPEWLDFRPAPDTI